MRNAHAYSLHRQEYRKSSGTDEGYDGQLKSHDQSSILRKIRQDEQERKSAKIKQTKGQKTRRQGSSDIY